MPAPRTTATGSAHPPAEARPQARPAAVALRYPSTRDFVFLCSPTRIDLVKGEALPRIDQFPIEPGLLGVPPAKNQDDPVIWAGAVAAECNATGAILVDPARYGLVVRVGGKVVEPADGEDRTDPRNWYVRRYRGAKGPIHVTVWQRPRVLGATVLWEHDEDGELDFRRQVAEKILGGIDPGVIEAVTVEAEQIAAELQQAAKQNPKYLRDAAVAATALGRKEAPAS